MAIRGIMNYKEQDQWKRAAAEAAVKRVEDGMVVGLGTGSTAAFFLSALGRRVLQEGLRIAAISTSEQTAQRARDLKIPITTFAEHGEIDLTVDGADEVQIGTLYLIKGHGGALLREKIVATASKQMIVIADRTKLVEELGSLQAVPVEVVQFGWEATQKKLQQLGGHPSIRLGPGKSPLVTDGGNYIIDCAFGAIEKPKETAHHLDHIVGTVEHGLFLGLASQAFVGGPDGVEVLEN
jgi:ribose 5-phosphate isomerase A